MSALQRPDVAVLVVHQHPPARLTLVGVELLGKLALVTASTILLTLGAVCRVVGACGPVLTASGRALLDHLDGGA